ncbi:VOC family protein [Paenibacillus oenotherae]|uniref:VOC family protein n=1 Tax=Paenibacillus oenotherae TaxID=1435645 RepID=A0ABS7DDU1_9BACL|nr:VOC family protein [Paenibacillus oenotherae]
MANANQKITPFLMFTGQAEEAMNFYISLFDDSGITSMLHHEDGTVLHAVFTLNGQTFMCIDSNLDHGFTFTPATSLFVNCNSSEEIDAIYAALTQEGAILMPIAPTPVSDKFAWVNDKFGVSWQLNLPKQ